MAAEYIHGESAAPFSRRKARLNSKITATEKNTPRKGLIKPGQVYAALKVQ